MADNTELVDDAYAELLTSTISGVEWKKRVDNGYKGKPYNWQQTAYGRAKLLLDQVVDVPDAPTEPEPPKPPTSAAPVYHVEITPNQYDTRDGPEANYQVCWLDHVSAHGGRTLERSTSDEWWMEWTFRIDQSWDTSKQGAWGRMFNSHVDWMAPGAQDVTSAQAIDYMGGRLMYHSEPGNNRDWTIHAALLKGVWHTLRWQSILGRVDGGTPRPGSARIWLDDNLAVDTGPINTIYRWTNGSLEAHQWLWNGFYSKGIAMTLKFDMSLCRFGKTEADMLADTGWKAASSFRLSDHLIPGKQDYGPATAVLL